MKNQKADGKRAGSKKLEKGIVENKKHTKEKDRRVKNRREKFEREKRGCRSVKAFYAMQVRCGTI